MGKRKSKRADSAAPTESYRHPEAANLMRPDVGTQAQFKKRKPPATYRYDSSLAPSMEWDEGNGARELGEWLLVQIEQAAQLESPHRFAEPREFLGGDGKPLARVLGLADAVEQLKRLGRPFLNWTGKAERQSFEVPTLPLFVHERLSTEAIIQTLTGHRKQQETQPTLFDLFGDPEHSVADQVLRAYEHQDRWVNRLILGDSLVVMNSLLGYEGLGGQVQMIYMDPPYGVKFGSNFQPFVRRRDVKHGDDEHMTREPEVVQAYRDTWELGLHSYLAYLRDRLLLARELLHPSGSIFVQISDDNFHHVKAVLAEVFGEENFIAIVAFKKTAGAGSPSVGTQVLPSVADYLLWFSKSREKVKYRQLYVRKNAGRSDLGAYSWVELPTGERRKLTSEERSDQSTLLVGSRIFRADNLTSQSGVEKTRYRVEFEGRTFRPTKGVWKTSEEGMDRLKKARRLILVGNTLSYVRYLTDFPVQAINNFWDDTVIAGFSDPKSYVVQTSVKIIQRCVLMTTDPGDLVLDPTCGSGTTAYVAEQWGRRWITVDTSRVPLALARQRLLTATFPWFELQDESRGPAGGFVYKRRQNRKGEEVGGIVPHVTLRSIANNEPPGEEVLVDRPEKTTGVTRVCGAFCVEGTIPTPAGWDETDDPARVEIQPSDGNFAERLLEILRRSPVLRLEGNRTVTLHNIRRPAKSLSLSAEALVEATAPGQNANLAEAYDEAVEGNTGMLPLSRKPVALVFGPENGAVSERLVYDAAKEANLRNYAHLYVIGFAIQPQAREFIEKCDRAADIPATYVQVTPDVMMGDLLKNMRSSQIFSVCGLPEIRIARVDNAKKGKEPRYQVELLGLDVFDPTTMEAEHRGGKDVPAWFLDTDYNGLCFHVSQAFFPRTGAWDSLRKALRGTHDEGVWDHLAGAVSAPFEAGERRRIAVKVIDDRGNELMVVRDLPEGR